MDPRGIATMAWFGGHLGKLFKINEGPVARIAAKLEPPVPFCRSIKRFASELPIKEVRLLLLVAVGLNTDVSVFLSHTLNFPQSLIKIVAVKVMQGGD